MKSYRRDLFIDILIDRFVLKMRKLRSSPVPPSHSKQGWYYLTKVRVFTVNSKNMGGLIFGCSRDMMVRQGDEEAQRATSWGLADPLRRLPDDLANSTLNASLLPDWSDDWASQNASAPDEPGAPSLHLWALVLMSVPILTLMGNALVIVAVYRERVLKSATNYYIVSLAFADLLVAAVVMPFAVYVLVSGVALSLPYRCLFATLSLPYRRLIVVLSPLITLKTNTPT